jgi:cytochrome c biogenesis protein
MNGVLRPVRMIWRRLTSMRTALILLFLLAVAAVPGSILPQKPLEPTKVTSYIKGHGAWGRFLNAIGMFDVFGSPWFAAIYLLLFISLVGCLIPRIRVHARGVARKPLAAPRNLERLPESGRFSTSVAPEEYAASARKSLGRRWRVAQRVEDSGAVTLSAEKGYSRESGNLMFHIALLVALVLIAIGQLYKYEGTKIVVQGTGMCNTISQYDSWTPGRFAAEGKVEPARFCIGDLTKFVATYTSSGEPSQFAADITYGPTVADATKHTTIKVNHPLRIGGDRIYLTGHGFAPTVTVRLPDGTIQTQTVAFLPTNATTLYSEGAFKIYGKNVDVGISGFFASDPVDEGNGVYTSQSPRVTDPVLGIMAYTGQINPNGEPQSVYTLDTTNLKSLGKGTVPGAKDDSKGAGANLLIGQTATFPGGVTVRFDGWKPYANLQVSHDPTQDYLLIAALAMVLGLAASLGVRRRRVWLRIAPAGRRSGGSNTVVDVGGLARSDSGNFTSEFAGLLARLEAVAAGGDPGPPGDADNAVGTDESVDADHSIRAGKD